LDPDPVLGPDPDLGFLIQFCMDPDPVMGPDPVLGLYPVLDPDRVFGS
jgi:hypothetical protein